MKSKETNVTKTKLFGVLIALAFAGASPALALDDYTLPSDKPVSYEKKTVNPDRTMDHIVGQAEKGYPQRFEESEVIDVMNASRKLKKENRPLAVRLERIASKMAHTEKK